MLSSNFDSRSLEATCGEIGPFAHCSDSHLSVIHASFPRVIDGFVVTVHVATTAVSARGLVLCGFIRPVVALTRRGGRSTIQRTTRDLKGSAGFNI